MQRWIVVALTATAGACSIPAERGGPQGSASEVPGISDEAPLRAWHRSLVGGADRAAIYEAVAAIEVDSILSREGSSDNVRVHREVWGEGSNADSVLPDDVYAAVLRDSRLKPCDFSQDCGLVSERAGVELAFSRVYRGSAGAVVVFVAHRRGLDWWSTRVDLSRDEHGWGVLGWRLTSSS